MNRIDWLRESKQHDATYHERRDRAVAVWLLTMMILGMALLVLVSLDGRAPACHRTQHVVHWGHTGSCEVIK